MANLFDQSYPWGSMRNIMFNNIWATVVSEETLREAVKFPELYPGEERQCVSICGIPDHPVESITLSNLHFIYPGGGTSEDAANLNAPELEDLYPEYFMWGVLPAYGMYSRHAKALAMSNVRFELRSEDARPAVVCDDVEDLDICGLRADLSPEADSLIKMRNTRQASLESCRQLGDVSQPAPLTSEF